MAVSIRCLNPYSNGMIIELTSQNSPYWDWVGLNPYSNGMIIERFWQVALVYIVCVLILILME